MGGTTRKRVLIVNCYIDDTRASIGRARKLPHAMAPAYLAGALSPQHCEIRIYSELFSGPLEDEGLLAWPDMLVLTGLTTALDRMRHVTAYARTKNPRVIVVAGGPAVRVLPRYCERYFDYACKGDVEELRDVVRDAFGAAYVAEDMQPRFDLTPGLGAIGYVESTRHCNFRCGFCSLTAEGRSYMTYDVDSLRRQIVALGRRRYLGFIDNNFFGNDRQSFLDRLDLLRELREQGYFRSWMALVTGDFFFDPANIVKVREAGCAALFSGVESFDTDWLREQDKPQNTRLPTVETIRATLEAGIVFLYGLVVDPSARSLADIRRELEFVLDCPDITLPSYVSLSIPMLGTPFFHDSLRRGLILPRTRVRDLDSTTISLQPVDGVPAAASFARDLQTFRGHRRRLLRHSRRFLYRYRSKLAADQLALAVGNAAVLAAPVYRVSSTRWRGLDVPRTYVSTTEVLDRVYKPAFPVESRYAGHFEPAMVSDEHGALAADLRRDLDC